jgi:hypothetical protein
MSKKIFNLVVVLMMLVVSVGCASGGDGGAGGEAALTLSGKIAEEGEWTEKELRGLGTRETEYTNKDGETTTYTGVSVNALLRAAGLQAGAAMIEFIADDGYTSEVSLADLQSCTTCIVAFEDDGTLRMVMPGFSGKAQVKGVVEINVK